jgi:hypothetical protein
MATWGKLKIQMSKYCKDTTLYYSYNTTSDTFYFAHNWVDNDWGGDGKVHKSEDYLNNEYGEAQMEAYINHYINMECSGDVEEFVKRYITNNRFKTGTKVE